MPKPCGDVEIIILRAIVKLNWWYVNGFAGSSVWIWMWILLVGQVWGLEEPMAAGVVSYMLICWG